MVRHEDLTTFYRETFVGDRVRRLRRIWKAECERLYDAADYAVWEINAGYSEQHAIADVVAGRHGTRRAA
jgi:hypothetical protein